MNQENRLPIFPLPGYSGFVQLVDYMGSDMTIVQAARCSTATQMKHNDKDIRLLRRLYRDGHHSPFEMCEMLFLIRAPIFVARQFFRHRTAHATEQSGRYSILAEDFYYPQPHNICYQHKENKQKSGDPLPPYLGKEAQTILRDAGLHAFSTYKTLLAMGVSRETARGVLPVNATTQFMWKQDLRNLLHLVSLRSQSDAQYETKAYSDSIFEFIKNVFPLVSKIFAEKEQIPLD